VSNVRTRGTLAANVDPTSPTAFNTLSNVYVTAIERSTPVQSTPVTAINLFQSLKLQTDPETLKGQKLKTKTPYTATYPDTPLSANPKSPVTMEITYPSTMTATPPLSAGPVESSSASVFSFAPSDVTHQVTAVSPVQSRRRPFANAGTKAPYTHPRSLHSILRNSPLPPSSALSPVSPRRQSLRLQEKAARRVGYESPLTQTITTEKYTKSHIDLLAEEASPYSASASPHPLDDESDMVLDLTMAYSGDETRDGGQTPGPFEEMRRRMTALGSEAVVSSPRPGGIRKRKKEKKRRWVWTIGQEDGEEDEGGAMAALRAASVASAEAATPRVVVAAPVKAATPEPLTAIHISVESFGFDASAQMDVEMSESSSVTDSSRATTPYSLDLDLQTPTTSATSAMPSIAACLGPVELINPETGSRRDTPIPPDLITS
jgi:hypothetical protein